MVDDGVQVLDAEGDARRLAEFADPLERALRGQPHLTGGAVAGPGRLAVDEFGGVQVEPRNTKRLSGFDAQLGRPHDLVGAGGIDQVALQVAGHRREPGSGGGKGVEVLVVPAPDLDCEAELVDAPDSVDERQVGEHHLGADHQLESASVTQLDRCTLAFDMQS